MQLVEWAVKHHVTLQALNELKMLFGTTIDSDTVWSRDTPSEAYVQSLVRLEAARKGLRLWRNNVGVLPGPSGQPVRYGLANDSKRLNEEIKSSDLIGWRPVLIGPDHVGSTIAQFVSRECKHPGWQYTGDAHEEAQLRWIVAVLTDGGDAQFCNAEGTL